MATEKDCGSASCLAKHVEGSLREAQKQGLDDIKTLMESHYRTMDQRIIEIRQSVEKQSDIIHPRLIKVEQEIVSIKTDIGQNGLDAKISQNSDVKWARGYKGFIRAVAVIVVAFAITSASVYFLFIYRTHGLNEVQQTQKSVRGN